MSQDHRHVRRPRTFMERLIADIWTDLMDLERVGADAAFVELGGNSLIATMVGNRLEEQIGFRPSMHAIFSGTLADLAEVCDRGVRQL